ncbi:YkvA family protein [Halobacillus mangrovi]|uniref:DUF1232 domain-containing protein n=1 Tax=Halobacillus mangrovi TaxID=402384 RepID=A0A1W6A043_9BACI|nr:DUF1232 domain-containing protein [Halobacillus mangrovi]ARI78882.1 hypothetical protein HM131_19540 [Halobacillus mangrovi]
MFRIWRRVKFVFNIRKSIPFLIRFFQSKEVSNRKKGLSIFFIVSYILFPWDIIPDFLLLLGIVDDVAVFTYIMQLMVKMAPESLKEEYRIEED